MISYLLADHLSSTVGTVNASTGAVTQMKYWPFGAPRTNHSPFGREFTGQQREGTFTVGAYYYKARFYSTVLGRFMSADPITVDGLNRYAYVRNNPLRYNDPSGLCVPGNCPGEDPSGLHGFAQAGLTTPELVQQARSWSECVHCQELNALAYASIAIPNGWEDTFWAAVAAGSDPHQWLNELTIGGAVACGDCDAVLASAIGSIPGLAGLGGRLLTQLFVRQVIGQSSDDLARIAARIVIKAHGDRHAARHGLDEVAVHREIILDIVEKGVPKSEVMFVRYIRVGGKEIEYHVYQLKDGTINVGTWYGPKVVP